MIKLIFSKIPHGLVLFILVFIPTFVELLISGAGNFTIALPLKLIAHFGLPIIYVMYVYHDTIQYSIKKILFDRKKIALKKQIAWGISGGVIAAAIILIAAAIIWPVFDIQAIVDNLTEKINITKKVFIMVAFWIIVVNPIMEEFFWRGFVLEELERLCSYRFSKEFGLVLTGVLFAAHHVVIVYDWFVWWQFILVTGFLSFAGIFLNQLKDKTGSILAPYIVHLFADIAIIIIGLIAFGYISV